MNMIFNRPTLNGAPVRTAEDVAADLMMAKAEEASAKVRRVKLEEEMISLLGIKDEGSKSHTVGAYRVAIKATVSRKVDWDVFNAVAAAVDESMVPVKVKRELDETGFKYLRDNEPELYAQFARAVTTTPTKPQVSINPIE